MQEEADTFTYLRETLSAQVDPYIERSSQQAAEVHRLLKEEQDSGLMSTEDFHASVRELVDVMDKDCPYLNKTVRVTGAVTYAELGGPDMQETELRTRYLENESVVARGYYAIRRLDDDGVGRIELQHLFELDSAKLIGHMGSSFLLPITLTTLARAPIDGVYIDAGPANLEVISHRLNDVMPDIIAEVDGALLEVDYDDQAHLALRDLAVPSTVYSPAQIEDLERYVQYLLPTVDEVPTCLRAQGEAEAYELETDTMRILDFPEDCSELLVELGQVRLRHIPFQSETGEQLLSEDLLWTIDVDILSAEVDGPVVSLWLPVNTITSMISVRREFYQARGNEPLAP